MKDFKGPRKGGFGGGSRGGFGGRGGNERGFGGRGGRNEFDRPEMHKAICSECGDKCEVPFRPNGTKPVLCSTCFGAQKGNNDSRSFGGRERMFDSAPVRTMFKATCQDCGATCEVPFKPMSGKPVYCSDCFRGSEGGKPSKNTERKERHEGPDFSALNSKLDQIIALLQTKNAPVEKFVMSVAKEEVEEPVKKTKTKKVAEKKAKVVTKAKKVKAVKK
ncbi:MAG: CxxC-x17-CxxC domain-containing protein [Bacillota bacterium]